MLNPLSLQFPKCPGELLRIRLNHVVVDLLNAVKEEVVRGQELRPTPYGLICLLSVLRENDCLLRVYVAIDDLKDVTSLAGS